MKKAILFVFALVIALLCVHGAAFAAGNYSVTDGYSFDKAWTAAKGDSGSTITLNKNVQLSGEYNLTGTENVTVDLNGYNIEGTGTGSDYIFGLSDKAKLTIKNERTDATGTIYISRVYEDYDQLILVENSSVLTLAGGNLKGNADDDCRVVYVEDARFNMSGGTIHDNVFDGNGAGVYVDDGTFSMSGGTISGMSGASFGGGVFVQGDGGHFNMSGGLIENNSAKYGGGIHLYDEATFNMSAGTISNNKGTGISATGVSGGGVSLDESSFTMTGGTISGNTAPQGGGVFYDGSDSSTFSMSGGLIDGNAADYGGGICLNDGGTNCKADAAVLSGGVISNNTACGGGGIYMDHYFDGAKITGDLIITGNTATEQPRPFDAHGTSIPDGGGGGIRVVDRDGVLGDNELVISGSVQVVGNSPTDVMTGPTYDLITIDPSIDTTPENHAWVGLSAVPDNLSWSADQLWYDNLFNENAKDLDYSVCFYGNGNQQALVLKEGSANLKYAITHMLVNLDRLLPFDGNAMRGPDGSLLYEGEDYTKTHNESTRTYTVRSQKSVNITDESMFLGKPYYRPELTNVELYKGPIVTKGDGETVYTLYYLEKNDVWDTTYTSRHYFDNYYYTVNIIIPNHAVNFDMNGHGEQVPYQAVTDQETAVQPTDPTAEDWIFGGWYTDSACTDGNEFDFTAPICQDITLYAKWTADPAQKYTVSFDMGGYGPTIADQRVKSGNTATQPAAPESDEADFQGWFADEDCTVPFDFNTPITADTIVYAGWAVIGPPPLPGSCTITYEMNGHGNQVPHETLTSGETPTVPDPAPSADGWTFGGWYSDKACTDGNKFDFSAPLLSDVTVHAKWTAVASYLVTFDMGGHGTQLPYQTVYSGETATAPADPAEDGWIFKGWFRDKGCTEGNGFDFSAPITQNTTVYAKWIDHECPDNIVVAPGQKPTCLEDGWNGCYRCSVCGNYFEDAKATTPINDYEQWKSDPENVLSATGHAWGNWEPYNDTMHCMICANDVSHVEYANHEFGSDDICDTCGYDRGGEDPVDPTDPDDPDDPTDPDDPDNPDPVDPTDPDNPGTGDSALPLAVATAALLLGGTGALFARRRIRS